MKSCSFLQRACFGMSFLMDVLHLHTDDRPAHRKFVGFDAIRAFAALGVVVLHACIPYLQHPMPGLTWPVRDASSATIDVLFWGIELFIMPVFLVMAGILAWRTVDRCGPRQVVKSRARRLLVPLAFGMLVVLPLDLYAWILGWISEGLVAPIKLKSMKFDGGIDRDLWGLGHLWFLQYVFLYVVSLASAVWLTTQHPPLRRWMPSNRTAGVVLLGVGMITLVICPEVVWGFQHSFLPVPSKWLYSGTFFFGGVLIAKSDPNLMTLRRSVTRLGIPAILLSAFTIALGRWHLAGGESHTANILLAAMTTVSAWLITLWIIAAATEKVKQIPVAVQYLAAASFWVYMVHHPFLGLIHTDLKWLLPSTLPAAKMFVAFTVCVGFSLLMYEGFVRKSGLGRWLGFDWTFPAGLQDTESTEQILPIDSPATPVEIPDRRAA